MGFLSSLFGVGVVNAAEPLNGSLSMADGFVDIDLTITRIETKSPNFISITARGKIRGAVVGFIIDLHSEWDERRIENANASFYWGKAHLRSIGSDSDAFSKLLASLYQLPCVAGKMPQSIDVAAVGLANDPRLVKSNPVKMKLFFNQNSQSNYAEIFLNLDLNTKILQFHEKDPEYRTPLLRTLCSGN